ncbi:ethanolamine utilization protein EutH [Anaerovorax odorimutans]|uniref:Ethanolamine utilization protein EutH n=1 Tax=Anaerovorax odorimutans TaxID=109327 RepID=A0ABT1RMN5_9FIRM|nr:ethanolamine utilization protein EutH [Anaerovorax odorimutans]
MDINQIIIYIMVFFALLGAADYIAGDRFGLGGKFTEGIMAMGPLTISMAGLLVLTPVISRYLGPVIVPVFQKIGADPAMFAGILFAIDMGGAPLAAEMTADAQAAALGGIITGSMLGATIVFTIPVALGIVRGEDRQILAKGILTGLITIPLGVITGGLTAGFSAGMVLRNTIPIAVISLAIAFGMWKWEKRLITIFVWFGRFIVTVSIIGLALGLVDQLTGFAAFEGMTSLKEVFLIIGNIAILLAGAFPLVHLITRLFEKPLIKAGRLLGINRPAAAGFLVSLANSIPMFGMLKDMDPRGKVMNMAFAVSGAFVLGDHLGFTASYSPQMIVPLLAGKLTAGVTAAALACLLSRRQKSQKDE